jgi:anti-anti-sigma factor
MIAASPPTPGLVSLNRHVVGHRTVLTVAGEVDIATAPELSAAIEAATADGAMELWIDLTQTEFMDSCGLHAILDAHVKTGVLGRRLVLICPPGAVRRLFEVTRVDGLLPVFDDLTEAQRNS